MLTPKETQISISAGLLHSFSEVTGYLTKLRNSLSDDNPLKKEFSHSIELLNMLEKAEIQTLINWCKE